MLTVKLDNLRYGLACKRCLCPSLRHVQLQLPEWKTFFHQGYVWRRKKTGERKGILWTGPLNISPQVIWLQRGKQGMERNPFPMERKGIESFSQPRPSENWAKEWGDPLARGKRNWWERRKNAKYNGRRNERRRKSRERQRGVVLCCFSSTSSAGSGLDLVGEEKIELGQGQFGNLACEFGWRVRRLVENEVEMRKVAQVQAEAFHVPVALFNDLFFEFFQAEVLAGLMYKLHDSPEDRYACLIAEPTNASELVDDSKRKLVGVVDVTVLRDSTVLSFLEGAEEYLYISGIAVLEEFRRQKVATVLLKACELLSFIWVYEYLVLRAYDDDAAALRLYTNAGYRIVSGDPPWLTSWVGRKRRVLMIKHSSSQAFKSNS